MPRTAQHPPPPAPSGVPPLKLLPPYSRISLPRPCSASNKIPQYTIPPSPLIVHPNTAVSHPPTFRLPTHPPYKPTPPSSLLLETLGSTGSSSSSNYNVGMQNERCCLRIFLDFIHRWFGRVQRSTQYYYCCCCCCYCCRGAPRRQRLFWRRRQGPLQQDVLHRESGERPEVGGEGVVEIVTVLNVFIG